MADDTNGQAASGSGPDDNRPDERIVEKTATAAVATPDHVPASRATEWTASDSRGPLNEATPFPHENPAHEEPPLEDGTQASAGSAARPGETKSTPASSSPSAAEPPRRRSLLPVAAAVIVGAVIGAGSAYLVSQTQTGANDGRDTKVAQLTSRVDALDRKPDTQQAITALKAAMAALDGKVAALQAAASATPIASTSPQGTTAAAAAPPTFDPAPLQQKIAALGATIDGLQKQAADAKALEAKVGVIQTSVDGLKTQSADVQKQASGAQAGIAAIQGQQKSFEGRISAPALAVVADSLVQQIDQGQPYNQQVDALGTLGADPARIAILRENARKGVPSAKALAAQFAPLADPILATEHKVAANAGLLDRLKNGMSSLVSIRSTSDTIGDGLDARVSRIEADLTHDDVTGAYNTWNALPADAKAKSEAWGALAKTSAEAIDAARALQQGAIASLGGRKS